MLNSIRITFLLGTLLCIALFSPAMAQVDTNHTSVAIALHGGGGYNLFRDEGSMPITFAGPCIRGGLDVEVGLPRWRFAFRTTAIGGMYNNRTDKSYDTYGADARASLEAWKRIWHKEGGRRQQLWVGIGLGDWIELKNNESLGNASTEVGNMAAPALMARHELMMRPRRNGLRWIWHTEIEVCPAGLLFRPGYPYMDNWSVGEKSMDNLFDTYEWHWCALPYMGWNTGVTLRLKNGNAVGLEYRWLFATTRNSGCYRYEEAAHTLRFNMIFAIR